MSALDDLKGRFLKFRTNKYAIYVGLALTFLVCTLLLLYSSYLICFGLLLVAIAGYYIPVLFGLKSKKKLAIWGIVLILLLALPYTLVTVDNEKAAESVKIGTADGSMANGTVTPFYGNASTVHVFSVEVTNSTYTDVRVIIYDVQSSTVIANETMTNNSGTLYTYGTALVNQTSYGYWFAANTDNGYVTTSTSNYGPLHVDDVALFGYWFPLIILVLLVQVGVLYFLLLAMSYWMERTRARTAEMQKQRQSNVTLPPAKGGKEEKFICSECGAEVPSSANRCPQCGERFDEDKEEPKKPAGKKDEFVCTECGATVDENAKTCWNCGKEFEN
jgi:ribosomal protein L40E